MTQCRYLRHKLELTAGPGRKSDETSAAPELFDRLDMFEKFPGSLFSLGNSGQTNFCVYGSLLSKKKNHAARAWFFWS